MGVLLQILLYLLHTGKQEAQVWTRISTDRIDPVQYSISNLQYVQIINRPEICQ